MPTSQPSLSDLHYVKQALDRDRHAPFPASIAVLWAVICGPGFVINDVAPAIALPYWAIASTTGFVISCWLGYRSSRAAGALDRREGLRWAMHFGALLVTFMVAAAGVLLGAFSGFQLGLVALLLGGVVFLLAGVHLARPLAGVGALMLGGVPLVLLAGRWQWTIVGLVVVTALLVVAAGGWRRTRDGEQ